MYIYMLKFTLLSVGYVTYVCVYALTYVRIRMQKL